MILEEKEVVETKTVNRNNQVKIPTVLESLKTQPKAMQVGPQIHLKKNWSEYTLEKIRGGIGNL